MLLFEGAWIRGVRLMGWNHDAHRAARRFRCGERLLFRGLVVRHQGGGRIKYATRLYRSPRHAFDGAWRLVDYTMDLTSCVEVGVCHVV